jgi:Fic family protein
MSVAWISRTRYLFLVLDNQYSKLRNHQRFDMPARRLSLIWHADPTRYAPARHRRACEYEAYLPARLVELNVSLSAETAGVVSDAEAAIHRLNADARPALAPLARLLLRTESIASSKVEGLQVGLRELARAEAKAEAGGKVGPTALEVLANIDAMQLAVDAATHTPVFTVAQITTIHARLMASAPNATRSAGVIRTTQNWIGGNDYTPCGADFVPPPPEYVAPLLEDLCAAINDTTLPPLVQAALVHAQFETIHPFDDGNGRTGRALIQVVLRRRRLAPEYVPPISVVLANAKDRYIAGLTNFRSDRVEHWVTQFAASAASAAQLAEDYLRSVIRQVAVWRAQLAATSDAPRADAAAWAVIDVLPAHPVLTAPVAAAATGRGKAPVYDAIRQLVTAGVLTPLTSGARNQSWEAVGLLDMLEELSAGALGGGRVGL